MRRKAGLLQHLRVSLHLSEVLRGLGFRVYEHIGECETLRVQGTK